MRLGLRLIRSYYGRKMLGCVPFGISNCFRVRSVQCSAPISKKSREAIATGAGREINQSTVILYQA